jgi:hypothetical protein
MESLESRKMDTNMELSVADYLLCIAKEEQLIADTWQAVVSELMVNEYVQAKDVTKWKTLPNNIQRMQIDHYENGSSYKDYSIVFPLSTTTGNTKENKFFTSIIRLLLNKDKLNRKAVEKELKKMKNLRFLNPDNADAGKVTLVKSVEIMQREAAKLNALANEIVSKVS